MTNVFVDTQAVSRAYVCVDPVRHELGLSVRRDEGDGSVTLEP